MPLDTPLGAAERATLDAYLSELAVWNARTNLTRVPREQWWARHIEESLDLAAWLPQSAASIVDVGSGAGLPGIPLAVLFPQMHVTLVESDQRKAGFLNHVSATLGLDNVTVIAQRAEIVGRDPDHRERHDVAVSRATAELRVLCELLLPLVRVGGQLLAMVADPVADAERASAAAALCSGDPPRAVADGVVGIVKRAAMGERYPRRVGVPGRRPLG